MGYEHGLADVLRQELRACCQHAWFRSERHASASGRCVAGKAPACAYRGSASPFAGVLTPLTWAEVHEGVAAGLRPHDFTLRSVFGPLAPVGDLWAALRTAVPARLEAAFASGE